MVLIPWLGLWGAAIATALSMIFEAGALSFTVWRKLGIVMAIFIPAGVEKEITLMAAVPLLEEMSGGPSSAMIAELAGLAKEIGDPAHLEVLENRRPERRLAIYPASAGFDLVEELDYLCARTVEPNVFFNPRFLAPAMPRLEDREVRLAVIRDGDEDEEPAQAAGAVLGRAPAGAVRRQRHAHLVEPVRPARHAAARPRRSGRRDRGLLRHAGAPASEAAEGAGAARSAARRAGGEPDRRRRRDARPGLRHHRRGRAARSWKASSTATPI